MDQDTSSEESQKKETDQIVPTWVKFIESELAFPKIERKEGNLE